MSRRKNFGTARHPLENMAAGGIEFISTRMTVCGVRLCDIVVLHKLHIFPAPTAPLICPTRPLSNPHSARASFSTGRVGSRSSGMTTPADLKVVAPYLARAKELTVAEPVIAYWCECGLMLHRTLSLCRAGTCLAADEQLRRIALVYRHVLCSTTGYESGFKRL